ncbi:MAG TPA: hypothetical protein PKC18_03260, partial [Lacipirellulaceae bacterium]|nr:hypothetical protein [Lacipirellulaceae bacterium]
YPKLGAESLLAMDPDVVNNPLYSGTIKNDLQAVPTVSLVMPWNDWFGGGGQGIFLHNGLAGTAIARPGMPAPGGGSYDSVDPPSLNAGGQVAFHATLTGTSSWDGVFIHDGAAAAAIAREGAAAAGGGTYGGFDTLPQVNSLGQVAFWSAINGSSSETGLFVSDGVTAAVVVRDNTPAPPGGTYEDLVQYALDSSGQMAFGAMLNSGAEGYFLHDGMTSSTIALEGGPSPAGGVYTALTRLRFSSAGESSYHAGLTGGASATEGIFLHDGTTSSAVALQGEPAPAGGTYATFPTHSHLNANGTVVYAATVAGGPSSFGIFVNDGTTAEAVALLGTPAPGTTGLYSSFSNLTFQINDAGLVVFRGALALGGDVTAANDTGFWFGTNAGNLSLLVREGDSLLVYGMLRTLGSIPLGFTLSESGIAWLASFTDGTSAVIYSQFPLATIPETSAWAMLALPACAATALAVKRRIRRAAVPVQR